MNKQLIDEIKHIKYVKGDATEPIGEGNKLIVHICNNVGKWGKGFVLALSKKWNDPEKLYRAWYNSKINFKLGNIQVVPITEKISVINMIGQQGIHTIFGVPPIHYAALKSCLTKVAKEALTSNASVHMPRIGCGLGGGKWKLVEPIIKEELIDRGIDVTVYDLS